MIPLRKFIPFKSIRRQYLFLSVLLAIVVIAYTLLTGMWIKSTSQTHSSNSEKRIEVIKLTHHIRRSIVAADNTLDLFLLSPSPADRLVFEKELLQARAQTDNVLDSDWVQSSKVVPILHEFIATLDSLKTAANQIMEVRQTADLLYPAMRLANGDMLEANRLIVTETSHALLTFDVTKLYRLNRSNLYVYNELTLARDRWVRLISAYRLFLINRMGSLYETVLNSQIRDVDNLYLEFAKSLKTLAILNKDYDYDLEVSVAIESMQKLGPRWYVGFRQVSKISADGQWRADTPLVIHIINPLFDQLYEKLVKIDDALIQLANDDIVSQTDAAKTITMSLWGMAIFILLLSVISYIVLEINFIRPIAKVASSLKAEAKGHEVTDLPDVQALEIQDLTEAFIELRQQVHTRQLALEHIAMHDSLTSLPNRALLMDRLNQAIINSQRRKRSLALLMLDLNRFKEINDTLGHQTGDALLQQVGVRLRNVLRDSDTVARLGGDEFAVLLSNVNDTNALRIAANIHERLEKVYDVYDHSLYVGVSIGVAIFPQHGESSQALLQHADVAMYVAKRSNTSITLYDLEQDENSLSQLSVLSDLRTAIENDEFVLEYQPTITMSNSNMHGAEALIRWNHPKHGRIMPDDFIPSAEQTGLIKRISNWVMDTAIRDCYRFHQKGHLVNISINLSVWDIQDANISLNITQKLEKWGLPAKYITLEITERVMMAEPERAREVLNNLDAMGLSVVIDDFGTGFSSLVYLKELPVSMLKIDKSFVIDMMHDESDAAIVHSIVELAHNLGLQVVAEGVESDQTWSWLKTWKCDYAQGNYISMPLSLASYERYLDEYTTTDVFHQS